MIPLSSPIPQRPDIQFIYVILDGRVLGLVSEHEADKLARKLRVLKAEGKNNVMITID